MQQPLCTSLQGSRITGTTHLSPGPADSSDTPCWESCPGCGEVHSEVLGRVSGKFWRCLLTRVHQKAGLGRGGHGTLVHLQRDDSCPRGKRELRPHTPRPWRQGCRDKERVKGGWQWLRIGLLPEALAQTQCEPGAHHGRTRCHRIQVQAPARGQVSWRGNQGPSALLMASGATLRRHRLCKADVDFPAGLSDTSVRSSPSVGTRQMSKAEARGEHTGEQGNRVQGLDSVRGGAALWQTESLCLWFGPRGHRCSSSPPETGQVAAGHTA